MSGLFERLELCEPTDCCRSWLCCAGTDGCRRRLAELLEVSERTILRDMESLSAAGVPVYTDRGRGGGCSLLPGYRTEVSGLSPAEAQALFAWTSGSGAAELGLSGELSSALTKLSATVPAPALEEAEALASVVRSTGGVGSRPPKRCRCCRCFATPPPDDGGSR
ncbi:MAG: HTH domain-containing protein [Micropruina glycogenica]